MSTDDLYMNSTLGEGIVYQVPEIGHSAKPLILGICRFSRSGSKIPETIIRMQQQKYKITSMFTYKLEGFTF